MAYKETILATAGLVAYWHLEEASGDFADSSGSGHLGSAQETGGITYAVAGALAPSSGDRAAAFGSTTGYFTAASDPGFDWADGPFTIEFWVRRNATGVISWLLDKTGGAGIGWAIDLETDGRINAIVGGATSWFLTDAGVGVTDTAWHHVVLTKNGATRALIRDGVVLNNNSSNQTVVNSTSAITIARSGAGSTNKLDGSLDEIALYNVALSADDAKTHYQLGLDAGYSYHPVIVTRRDVGPRALRRAFRYPPRRSDVLANAMSDAAAGTGAANAAAINLQPNAANAGGTGAAGSPSSSVAPVVGAATGTGSAGAAAASLGANAANAAGTGVAGDAAGSVAGSSGAATGTGSVGAPAGAVAVNGGLASGTASAYDATVTTGAATNAQAGNAAGTGAASDTAASVAVSAGAASGNGAAFDATVTTAAGAVNAPAGLAAGSGQAFDATTSGAAVGGRGGRLGPAFVVRRVPQPAEPISIAAYAEVARGYGRAYDANVTWDDDEFAILLLAS